MIAGGAMLVLALGALLMILIVGWGGAEAEHADDPHGREDDGMTAGGSEHYASAA